MQGLLGLNNDSIVEDAENGVNYDDLDETIVVKYDSLAIGNNAAKDLADTLSAQVE